MLRRKPLFRNERPGMAPRVRGEQVTVMSRHNPPTWGLKIPGRPATPSEGAAQQYDRVGPAKSQKLFTFDNGTSLKYGPEDPVDEFDPSRHPFVNQIALVDTVIRECNAARARFETGPNTENGVSQSEFIKENDPFINFRQREYHGPIRHIKLESGFYSQVPSAWASVMKMPSVYATFNKSDFIGNGHPGLEDTRYGVSITHDGGRDESQDNYRALPPPAQNTRNALNKGGLRNNLRGERSGDDRGGRGGRGDRSRGSSLQHNTGRPTVMSKQHHNPGPLLDSNHGRCTSRDNRGPASFHRGRGRGRGGRCNFSSRQPPAPVQIHVDLEDHVPQSSFRTVRDNTRDKDSRVRNNYLPRQASHYADHSYEALMAENERLVEADQLDSSKYFISDDDRMRTSDGFFNRVDAWNDGGDEHITVNGFHLKPRIVGQHANVADLPPPGFLGVHDCTFQQGYEEESTSGSLLSTTAINTNNNFYPPASASGEQANTMFARFLDEMGAGFGVSDDHGRVGIPHSMNTFQAIQRNGGDLDIVQAATARRIAQKNTDQGSPVGRHRARPPHIGETIRDRRLNSNRINLGGSLTRPTTPLMVNTGPLEPPRSRSANFLRPRGDVMYR